MRLLSPFTCIAERGGEGRGYTRIKRDSSRRDRALFALPSRLYRRGSLFLIGWIFIYAGLIASSNSYERYTTTNRKGLEFSSSRKINDDCLAVVSR